MVYPLLKSLVKRIHSMKRQQSVMKHQFSQVPKAEIQRSSFDRSHGLKTTFDGGFLYPIFCDEALPGDSFNLSMTGFARLATPIFPIMDNMRMETFFFAVPNRLLWDNWQKFNGEQTNPGDSTDFTVPQLVAQGPYDDSTIFDYIGLPIGVGNLTYSAFWLRAYNLIWNEWFRDQNMQDSVTVHTGDTGDLSADYELLRRGKRHDYFTSCLPWPQKGDPVSIPISGSAPVTGIGSGEIPLGGAKGNVAQTGGITSNFANSWNPKYDAAVLVNGQIVMEEDPNNPGFPGIYADLSAATTITINELREAFQIQRLLERDARGGTRYIEIIKAHFGVTSPDARLQRPEYLGGGSSVVNISPIASTVPTSLPNNPTPQGNLAAVGTSTLHNHGFTKSFTEHCTIIGLVSVRADLTYQQGLPRMFSRETRYDFYWPALSHLGEQAVLNQEIFHNGDPVNDTAVFGYQERYAEYRYKPSQITGKMRSAAVGTLDAWHLSQDFADLPVLGSEFIQDNPPLDRIVAVPSEPKFIFDGYFNLRCARPMPLYGVPGLIDHF
ncbi:major capsid protein [Microviridae sp.]|nr:major capsid protein [Microviridae sp.]